MSAVVGWRVHVGCVGRVVVCRAVRRGPAEIGKCDDTSAVLLAVYSGGIVVGVGHAFGLLFHGCVAVDFPVRHGRAKPDHGGREAAAGTDASEPRPAAPSTSSGQATFAATQNGGMVEAVGPHLAETAAGVPATSRFRHRSSASHRAGHDRGNGSNRNRYPLDSPPPNRIGVANCAFCCESCSSA